MRSLVWTPALVVMSIVLTADRGALAQCAPWGQPVNLSNSADRYAVDGNMAVDGAGKLHVIYQDFLDADGKNYYVNNLNGFWSSPQLAGNMNGKGSTPRIVRTPDDQLHIFYGHGNLQWRTKPVTGGSWSAPVELSSDGFIYNAVVDDAGGIYFLFGELFQSGQNPRNGVWGRYKPLGGGWAAKEVIYGNGDDSNWPRAEHLAVHGTTLWVSYAIGKTLYYKKKTAGTAWPAGIGTQFPEGTAELRFAFSPVGNEMVASFRIDTGGGESDPWFELYVKYSNDDGASWGPTFNFTEGLHDIDRNEQLAYDQFGNLHAVWESFYPDHKLHIRYRSRIAGVWGSMTNLTPNNASGITWDALRSYQNQLLLLYNLTGSGVTGRFDVYFNSATNNQPKITLSKSAIEHTIYIHQTIPNDTFTISNACIGTLNYSLTSSAPWLAVTPPSGVSTSNVDTATLAYTVSNLNRGIYNATVTASGNAWNNPQTIAVKVTVATVRPDFDGDGDVDQADFGHLQTCLSGAAVPQTNPACADARLDSDDDVDQNDFGVFQGCVSGANNIAVQNCAG